MAASQHGFRARECTRRGAVWHAPIPAFGREFLPMHCFSLFSFLEENRNKKQIISRNRKTAEETAPSAGKNAWAVGGGWLVFPRENGFLSLEGRGLGMWKTSRFTVGSVWHARWTATGRAAGLLPDRRGPVAGLLPAGGCLHADRIVGREPAAFAVLNRHDSDAPLSDHLPTQ